MRAEKTRISEASANIFSLHADPYSDTRTTISHCSKVFKGRRHHHGGTPPPVSSRLVRKVSPVEQQNDLLAAPPENVCVPKRAGTHCLRVVGARYPLVGLVLTT